MEMGSSIVDSRCCPYDEECLNLYRNDDDDDGFNFHRSYDENPFDLHHNDDDGDYWMSPARGFNRGYNILNYAEQRCAMLWDPDPR